MDQNQRRARLAAQRQAPGYRPTRTAPIPDSVHTDLNAIDAATTDPTIRALTARIRTALTDGPPPVPCPATEPAPDGGTPYTCSLTTPNHDLHLDEQRSVWWTPGDDTTEGAR
ncbi:MULTISPECIES: hypothetical protein [Streptomyces]|uniref:hypothetical protein n=1 Tax=Streptomyces TaxID=1883 RepID=UPI0004BDB17B|nr:MULTISPECIES: hypothetical protein [Streptomyces]KOG84463.1 hypothetical protein ADK33_03400 [Streptomyces griseus subsp. rhodochrous]